MPDPTPNRGYNRPDQGTSDWHTPVNANWTMIDDDIQQALDQAASGGTTVFDSFRLSSDLTVPARTDVELFSYTVPEDGIYDLTATAEYDTSPIVDNSAALTRIAVNGTREMIERAVLVPVTFGTGFQSIPTAFKGQFQQGDTIVMETRHAAEDGAGNDLSLQMDSNPWNTAFMIQRTGPLP